MYRIFVLDDGRWVDTGEGPWEVYGDALLFARAEVGLPWRVVCAIAGGTLHVLAYGDATSCTDTMAQG